CEASVGSEAADLACFSPSYAESRHAVKHAIPSACAVELCSTRYANSTVALTGTRSHVFISIIRAEQSTLSQTCLREESC
ncbi:hypothetical protein M9458_054224, partial [Cirrhinus mrigala]